MDVFEWWYGLLGVVLILVHVGVSLRRQPMFIKDNVTPEALTKQIEFGWPAAGSSMVLALYFPLYVFVERLDVTATVLLSLVTAMYGIAFLLELGQIARLARQRRQLVRAANASPATEDGTAE